MMIQRSILLGCPVYILVFARQQVARRQQGAKYCTGTYRVPDTLTPCKHSRAVLPSRHVLDDQVQVQLMCAGLICGPQ